MYYLRRYYYQYWGVESLSFRTIRHQSDYFLADKWWFVKKHVKVKYTEQENEAFAVFGIIIVLSVIEIILAAALAKVSDSSQKGGSTAFHPNVRYALSGNFEM